MHLVMQYLELGGPDPEEQVRRLTDRRLLTPQQAEAVDMERIRAFLATPLAQRWAGPAGLAGVSLCPADAGGAVRPGGGGRGADASGRGQLRLPHGGGACGGGLQDRPSGSRRGAAAGGGVPAQLEAYAQALERVMEEKVCRKVLYFFSTGATINL